MNCIKCKKEIPDASVFCLHCGHNQSEIKPAKKPKSRGNGLGTVYKLNGKWVAEKTFGYELKKDGKYKRNYKRQKGIATRKEAEAIRASWEAKPRPNSRTVQQLWEFWSENKLPKLSKDRQTAYNVAYRKLGRTKFMNIEDIGVQDLQSLIRGLTYYPARDIKNLFSHLYKIAMADRIVDVNVSEFIELPPLETQETEKISRSEVDNLWQAWNAGDTFAGYILLLAYTGMMPGELFLLKKDMIDYPSQSIIGCGLKTKKRRTKPIVFPDFIAPLLQKLCELSKSRVGNVLCMNKDKFYAEFKELKIRCGIRDNVKPYSARRSTGSDLALQDVAPALITDIMRQTDYQTTVDHYNKFDTSELVAAVNKMYKPASLFQN